MTGGLRRAWTGLGDRDPDGSGRGQIKENCLLI